VSTSQILGGSKHGQSIKLTWIDSWNWHQEVRKSKRLVKEELSWSGYTLYRERVFSSSLSVFFFFK